MDVPTTLTQFTEFGRGISDPFSNLFLVFFTSSYSAASFPLHSQILDGRAGCPAHTPELFSILVTLFVEGVEPIVAAGRSVVEVSPEGCVLEIRVVDMERRPVRARLHDRRRRHLDRVA